MSEDAGHERLLIALAQAMVDQPRATLQELAKAVGVSKATLYRFCQTRDQLVTRLMTHSAQVMKQTLADSRLDAAPTREALRNLIEQHLAHKELTVFLMYNWKPDMEMQPDIMQSLSLIHISIRRGRRRRPPGRWWLPSPPSASPGIAPAIWLRPPRPAPPGAPAPWDRPARC